MIANLRALWWTGVWFIILPVRAFFGLVSEILDSVHWWVDRRIR